MRRGSRAKMQMRLVHSLHGTRGDARATRVQSDTSELQSDECTHEYARERLAQLGRSLQALRWRSRTLIRTRPRASSTCIRAIT